MTKEEEKILNSGELYGPRDFEANQASLIEKVNQYNRTPSSAEGRKKREAMLQAMLGHCGKEICIEPPFHSNWGGKHVYIGDYFYSNFNLTLVDDGNIVIGDYVRFGPNVTLVTATHPISPSLRKYKVEYNKQITIGNNVWIGANSVILPGVKIGNNSIIGAGSLVTKDIPDNVVAFGSPAKVYREITDEDFEFYDHGKKIKQERLEKYGF